MPYYFWPFVYPYVHQVDHTRLPKVIKVVRQVSHSVFLRSSSRFYLTSFIYHAFPATASSGAATLRSGDCFTTRFSLHTPPPQFMFYMTRHARRPFIVDLPASLLHSHIMILSPTQIKCVPNHVSLLRPYVAEAHTRLSSVKSIPTCVTVSCSRCSPSILWASCLPDVPSLVIPVPSQESVKVFD